MEERELGQNSGEQGEYAVSRLGRYEVMVEPTGTGIKLHYQDDGSNVTFELSPNESLRLAELVSRHREVLEDGLQYEEHLTAVNGGRAVTIYTGRSEPFPLNNSVR